LKSTLDCNHHIYLKGIVMQSYETSRKVLGFFEFCAWCAFGGGAILLALAASALANGGALSALTFGAGGGAVALLAMIGIVVVQMSRAGLDTAEYTGQLLKVARDQLEVSRDANRVDDAPIGFSAPQKDVPAVELPAARVEPKIRTRPRSEDPQEIEYRGKKIRLFRGKYSYNDIPFNNLTRAQKYLDEHVLIAKK
jgi:hypothetical protein